MLDDLRSNLDDSYDNEEEENLPINFDALAASEEAEKTQKPARDFLGLTAGERAFLSMMIFLVILVFGAAILAVTGRITL